MAGIVLHAKCSHHQTIHAANAVVIHSEKVQEKHTANIRKTETMFITELRQTGNFWDYKNYNYCMEMCQGDHMFFRFSKVFKKCPNCLTKARTKPRVGKCRRKFGNLYNKRI